MQLPTLLGAVQPLAKFILIHTSSIIHPIFYFIPIHTSPIIHPICISSPFVHHLLSILFFISSPFVHHLLSILFVFHPHSYIIYYPSYLYFILIHTSPIIHPIFYFIPIRTSPIIHPICISSSFVYPSCLHFEQFFFAAWRWWFSSLFNHSLSPRHHCHICICSLIETKKT
jgi:hypothetical protein